MPNPWYILEESKECNRIYIYIYIYIYIIYILGKYGLHIYLATVHSACAYVYWDEMWMNLELLWGPMPTFYKPYKAIRSKKGWWHSVQVTQPDTVYPFEYDPGWFCPVWARVRVQVRTLVTCVSTITNTSTWLLHEYKSESEYWLMSTSTNASTGLWSTFYIRSSIAFCSLWKGNPQILTNLGQNCPLSM